MKTLLYTASDSGFDLRKVPLGGAAPICAFLTDAWRQQSSFEFRLLSPDVLGADAPRGKDLLQYTPKQYVDFYFKFERAITEEILRHDPRETVILSNDMSDGPSFRVLSEKGYSVYCIYHMNMVHYFTSAFLRGVIRPETAASVYRVISDSRFRFLLPRLLELVFLKQEESLSYCRGIIVPSEGMKRLLVRMYPHVPASKIHVFPWGSQPDNWDETLLRAKVDELRRAYAIQEGIPVLIMLSRVSPEKGQDRLLNALEIWERADDFPSKGICVLLCGVAGYAQAKAFEKKLMKRAEKLKKARVIFPGYVYGLDKQAHFRLADLYVFPSRQESYGLTLMEAFRAGLPAVATSTDGTEQLVCKEFGELLPAAAERDVPRLLKDAIQRMLASPEKLRDMGQRAQEFANAHPFSETANRLAQMMMTS
jgi:glycosyltransferase involved in cell wall biosynthesis